MTDERQRAARAFLQEAVYRSRARQAAGVGLAGGQLDEPSGPANCGLGEKAAVELDLTPKGEELFRELWPDALESTQLARIHEVMGTWIRAQDALDRKRNHFLRDFRHAHGFDRRAYSAEETEEYDSGLEAINAEAARGLDSAASELLG